VAYGYADLNPQQQEEYKRLNAEYRALFGAGNFGDFDYNAYLNDPKYAQTVQGTIYQGGNRTQKQLALNKLTDFFKGVGPGQNEERFQPIDLNPIFDKLGGEINKSADQSLLAQQEAIQRRSERSQEQAKYALAGTGLGQSGVAADTFQGIGQEAVQQERQAAQNVEIARSNAQNELNFKRAQMEYAESLRVLEWKEEDIRAALDFDRMLYKMQFGTDEALRLEEQAGGGWEDVFAGIVDLGSQVGSAAILASAL